MSALLSNSCLTDALQLAAGWSVSSGARGCVSLPRLPAKVRLHISLVEEGVRTR